MFTAEETADEMSSGFNRAQKRLSQPAAFRGPRGDVPRTGEEQETQLQVFTRLMGTLGAGRLGGSTKSPVSAGWKNSLVKS